MRFSTSLDNFVCGCCGQLKKESERTKNSYKDGVITRYICKSCNIAPSDRVIVIIDIVKCSNNDFIKSLIDFYNEKGYLTVKQFNSIRLNNCEKIEYFLQVGNEDDLYNCFNYADTKQRISIINKLINIANNSNDFYKVDNVLLMLEEVEENYTGDLDKKLSVIISEYIKMLENKLKTLK